MSDLLQHVNGASFADQPTIETAKKEITAAETAIDFTFSNIYHSLTTKAFVPKDIFFNVQNSFSCCDQFGVSLVELLLCGIETDGFERADICSQDYFVVSDYREHRNRASQQCGQGHSQPGVAN